VLFKLIFDTENGIILEMLKTKNSLGILSISELVKSAEKKWGRRIGNVYSTKS